MQMCAQRTSKIDRYKKQKDEEKRLADLRKEVDKEHVDEEVKVST